MGTTTYKACSQKVRACAEFPMQSQYEKFVKHRAKINFNERVQFLENRNVTIFTTRVANKYLLYTECCVKFCKLCHLSYCFNMCIRHVGGSRADAERGAGARAAAPRPVVGARRHSAAHAQAARGNYTTAIVSWYMWKEATRS